MEKKNRSSRANAYMWSVVIKALMEKAASEGNPISKEEAKHHALIAVGHWEHKKRWGTLLIWPKPTKNMSTGDFEGLLERIRAWAKMQLEIDILLPGEGTKYPAWTEDRL